MKLFLNMLFLLLPLLLAAEITGEDADTIRYKQFDGSTVTLRKHPKRVVVAYGSFAKVWDLANGHAVGVPDLADKETLPESMRSFPAIGSATLPNAEKVVSLNPDLIFLSAKQSRHRAIADLFRKTGVSTVCVDYANYGDFYDLLDLSCRLNGKKIQDVPAAKKVTDDVEKICSEAKNGKKSPVCAILFASAMGFTLESKQTNTGMMADKLGATNIVKTSGKLRTPFSTEQLLISNPDVIFIITMGGAKGLREKFNKDYLSQPAWKELKAVKSGRIHFLPSGMFLYMPGPDYPEAFRYLANLLYPENVK